MKLLLNLSRILVGLLFIFSGLVKAIDPLGLSYKMQEFFEAWNWHGWDHYTLALSVIMIGFEIVAGVALLLGWQMRLFGWLLLLLILFFTFLTSYVLFSGKIKACGCFGDCIPLTPIQTFTKDIILTILIFFLFFNHARIKPLLQKGASVVVLLGTMVFCVWIQWYVLQYLPLKDCLPYKIGNNLLQQMQVPADAIPDSTVITFVYEKDGQLHDFTAETLPADLGTYKYVDRKERVIREGMNNQPPIKDFVLFTAANQDTTRAVLEQAGEYYILFRKDFDEQGTGWQEDVQRIALAAKQQGKQFLIVTGQRDRAEQLINQQLGLQLPILTCDVTAIKTAARTNPCLYKMNGPVVVNKWGFADFKRVKL